MLEVQLEADSNSEETNLVAGSEVGSLMTSTEELKTENSGSVVCIFSVHVLYVCAVSPGPPKECISVT